MSEWRETARMLIDSAGAVVPKDGDLTRIRQQRFSSPGFSFDAWKEIADAGWLSMRLSESAQGAELGMRECCSLLQVLGSGLVPEPVISSMLAFNLLAEHVPEEVLHGEKVLVTAWQDATNSLEFRSVGQTSPLKVKKVNVSGVAGADLFAVWIKEGVALVPSNDPGVSITAQTKHDGCISGTVHFDSIDVPVYPVDNAERILDEAVLTQSAYLLGLSESAFQITLDYLRVREQFGRPIGSFQSLQHRASDIKIQLELARASLFAIAGKMDSGCDTYTRQLGVSRCKSRAAELAMLVARESIQMHGAIGLSDEANIGLYVRKAMAEANNFGSASVHRARYSATLELAEV